MHVPPHPLWFWLIVAAPFIFWLVLWLAANTLEKSVKPLMSWLYGDLRCEFFGCAVPFPGLREWAKYSRKLRFFEVVAWSCYTAAFWIKRRYMFETLRGPGASGIQPSTQRVGFRVPPQCEFWCKISIRSPF